MPHAARKPWSHCSEKGFAVLLDGVHVPLTVPFYSSGESYLRKLEHNVRRYCLGPIAGLVALAPGAEAEALSDGEQAETLRTVAATASAEKVLVAGVRRSSVHQALATAKIAHEAEFDAVLLGAPLHWPRMRGAQERAGELALFFQAVADQSPLPVVLWSDSRPPELQLGVGLLASLATHPNILGLYDADLTPERLAAIRQQAAGVEREVTVTTVFAPVTRRMLSARPPVDNSFVPAGQLTGGTAVLAPPSTLRTRTRRVNFQIMAAGSVRGSAGFFRDNVAGMLPSLAACAPQACHEVYAAFKDGNQALAAEKEERLWLADEVMGELGPVGLKYACDLNGFYGGRPRLPLLPLTGGERARVEGALRAVRS